MAQADAHEQKMVEMAKHKGGHVAYWKAHNKETDPKRYEDGFIQGWSDAENKTYPNINRDSMVSQRKNENVAHCGHSPYEWAFEHGYREGFDACRCPPNENTHDAKMAEMRKHKDAHIAYWKAYGHKQTDPQRFEDGFIQGWCDCEHNLSSPNVTVQSFIGKRHQEHVKTFGNSPSEWAFGDGYREGFEARKGLKPKPALPLKNTHDQKLAELAKHKDGHVAYWKAHGNKPTDPKRFEDGFIQGWCDCEKHISDHNVTVNSLILQRLQGHVKSYGDSPCAWAFNDGYREGWEGRRYMKPPQAPTYPLVTRPDPPKVSDCGPTEVTEPPPTNYPAAPTPPKDPEYKSTPVTPNTPTKYPEAPPPAKDPEYKPTPNPPLTYPTASPPVKDLEYKPISVTPNPPATYPSAPPPTKDPEYPVKSSVATPPVTYPSAPLEYPAKPPVTTPPITYPTAPPPTKDPEYPAKPPVTTPPVTYPSASPPTKDSGYPAKPPVTTPPVTYPASPSPTKDPEYPAKLPVTPNPPVMYPVKPPVIPNPPVTYPFAPTPTKPTDCAPTTMKPTPTPAPRPADHHCTSDCTHSKDQPCHSTPAPKPPKADNHCHTDVADLPADHHCTSECNHAKRKLGLLEKIEHALHLD